MKSLCLLSLLVSLFCSNFAGADDAPPIDAEIAPSPLRVRLEKALRQDIDPGEARHLIEDLGHIDFSTRIEATRKLLASTGIHDALLESAVLHDDPEIHSRARRISFLRPTLSAEELKSILFEAAAQKPPDIADLLLEIIAKSPSLSTTHLALAVAEACTCDAKGTRVAESQIASTDLHLQSAAISLLVRSGHTQFVRDHLIDFSPPMLAEAGRALWNHGHPGATEIWVGLLESEDLGARVAAAQYLREATSHRFGFSPFAEKIRRLAAAKLWKAWLADHHIDSSKAARCRIASLTDPLCPANYRLAATGKSVFFISSGGSFIATLSVPQLVGAAKMTSSDTLILFSRLAGSGVLETTLAGYPFRKTKAKSVVDVTTTGDGGILMQRGKRLSEETPDGTVIWKKQIREFKGKPAQEKRDPKH